MNFCKTTFGNFLTMAPAPDGQSINPTVDLSRHGRFPGCILYLVREASKRDSCIMPPISMTVAFLIESGIRQSSARATPRAVTFHFSDGAAAVYRASSISRYRIYGAL